MTTRAVLKAEILDDLERTDAVDGARVLSAISAAIKFYQPKRFFFNETRSVTFATVADQWQYTFGTGGDITTEFYRIDKVIITEGGNNHYLCRGSYEQIELLNDTNATSNRPIEWDYVDRSLVFYPIPDAAYTVRLLGHYKYAEPASDGEADNEWFTEAYELIRCRAKAYLYGHVYPSAENVQMAAVMRAAERDALSSLMSATASKTTSGMLMPTDF